MESLNFLKTVFPRRLLTNNIRKTGVFFRKIVLIADLLGELQNETGVLTSQCIDTVLDSISEISKADTKIIAKNKDFKANV